MMREKAEEWRKFNEGKKDIQRGRRDGSKRKNTQLQRGKTRK